MREVTKRVNSHGISSVGAIFCIPLDLCSAMPPTHDSIKQTNVKRNVEAAEWMRAFDSRLFNPETHKDNEIPS